MAKRIVIDKAGVMRDLAVYLTKVMERICDLFITYVHTEMPMYDHVAAGKFAWREQVRDDFRRLSIEVSNDMIQGKVGLPYAVDSREYIIAMIMNKGHSGEIWTRPGEEVWDSNMEQTTSEAPGSWRIPQFEYEGSDFLDNARERFAPRFEAEVRSAVDNMPPGIVNRHIKFV